MSFKIIKYLNLRVNTNISLNHNLIVNTNSYIILFIFIIKYKYYSRISENTKKFSICHKLKFVNPDILAT